MTRNQRWLERLLETISTEHFQDVKWHTPLLIRFGRRARNRLGSLSYDANNHQAVIRLTRLFEDVEVPETVIRATIIHELCHYAHGFSLPGRPKYRHPHANGVIRQEFAERGLETLYVAQKRWLKAHWPAIVRKHFPKIAKRRGRLLIRYRII